MKHNAYKDAGVDVDAAAKLVENIKPHTKKTKRPGVMGGIGGFGALFDLKETGYKDPLLVSATDGVGTKIKIAIDLDRHDTIGIDAVAMCVNDLIVQGAEPLFFLDYFATGHLNAAVAEDVIASVAEGCLQSGCALVGGETAEMPGLYAPGDYDLAGFCVGAVERDAVITGQDIYDGDVILGLASNGVHSNGFSLVRKIIADTPDLTFESKSPFDAGLTLGELLLMPTRIYVRSILEALQSSRKDDNTCDIKGMVHVTGGGFYENIPRVLPENMQAHVNCNGWALPPLFSWLKDLGGLSNADLANTLNCGIGYIVVCPKDCASEIQATLEAQGETVFEIGSIAQKSSDTDPDVLMQNMDQAWGA